MPCPKFWAVFLRLPVPAVELLLCSSLGKVCRAPRKCQDLVLTRENGQYLAYLTDLLPQVGTKGNAICQKKKEELLDLALFGASHV